MQNITNEILATIKQYRFAELPTGLLNLGEKSEEKDTGRYSVQCQVCGRMGAMTVEDMKKHSERHIAQQKKEEGTDEEQK